MQQQTVMQSTFDIIILVNVKQINFKYTDLDRLGGGGVRATARPSLNFSDKNYYFRNIAFS